MPRYFAQLFSFYKQRPFTTVVTGCGGLALGTAGYWGPLYYAEYQQSKQQALNSSSFTPYTLIDKHRISATSSIFTLRPPPSERAAAQLHDVWENGSTLWSVQAKQPHLQIGREYTPLPPSPSLARPDAG